MRLNIIGIYASSVFLFILFGSFLYKLGIIAEISDGSGTTLMICGIAVMSASVAAGLLLRKKRHVMSSTAIGSFSVAGHNMLLLTLFTGEELEILKTIHMYITYCFLVFGIVASVLGLIYFKRKTSKLLSGDFPSDPDYQRPKAEIEYGRFKYCPKCLYQIEVDSSESECPECHVDLKMPDPFKPGDASLPEPE